MTSRRHFLKGLGAAALLPALPSLGMTSEESKEKLDSHRVLSCNIRVALDEDETKGVGWSSRKNICIEIIKDKNADIICLQEVLKVQAEDFRKSFPSYQLFGFDGPEMDMHATGYHGIAKNPILFSNSRYHLLGGGTYWLSETPLVAGSKSWDTARARHVNWVRLREKSSDRELRVINLHLDHVSGEAKIRQAKMVVEESAQYPPGFAQIMAGDFNTRHDSRVFDPVRKGGWLEAYETIHGAGEAGYTGHKFQGTTYEKAASKGRIDFIWYKGKLKTSASTIIRDSKEGKFPSDHFFMQADFVIE
ncbi:MAG TPA: endonuclease/exonuclease/phosphatase family protein [Chitinophagaceae bacterium]|nr:endonuclease/exonuclease/phosphatase family protein [Chitinophagaceae bacterium]